MFSKVIRENASVKETLMAISNHRLRTLEDIRIFGYIRPTTKIEEFSGKDCYVQFTNAYEQKLYDQGKIPESNLWKYCINTYGFRDLWDLSDTEQQKIGCFGDSFTFGDGLPSNELHSHYLQELSGARIFNVGKGGASIDRIARIFSVFTKFVDLDVAVFTLPHVFREFFIDPRGIVLDLIPSMGGVHSQFMQPFHALHDNYQLSKMSFAINYILDVAAERNIKVLFTTWDMPTFDLLKMVSPNNSAEELFPNNIDPMQARDLMHPGKLSQQKHAQNIMKELYDRTWI